jgi:hypothetical protein
MTSVEIRRWETHGKFAFTMHRAHVKFLASRHCHFSSFFGALSQRVLEAVLFHSVAALFFVLISAPQSVGFATLFPFVLERLWGLRKRFLECKVVQFIPLRIIIFPFW